MPSETIGVRVRMLPNTECVPIFRSEVGVGLHEQGSWSLSPECNVELRFRGTEQGRSYVSKIGDDHPSFHVDTNIQLQRLSPPLPFTSLPLRSRPLKYYTDTAREFGGALSAASAGSGAGPQRKTNLMYFNLKIWHMVARTLLIFLRINCPQTFSLFSFSVFVHRLILWVSNTPNLNFRVFGHPRHSEVKRLFRRRNTL